MFFIVGTPFIKTGLKLLPVLLNTSTGSIQSTVVTALYTGHSLPLARLIFSEGNKRNRLCFIPQPGGAVRKAYPPMNLLQRIQTCVSQPTGDWIYPPLPYTLPWWPTLHVAFGHYTPAPAVKVKGQPDLRAPPVWQHSPVSPPVQGTTR